ncbi:NfeD-like family protein (fragment) [Methylacidimicrobium sp. AP8]
MGKESSMSEPGTFVPAGSRLRIVAVEGIRVVVERVEEEE